MKDTYIYPTTLTCEKNGIAIEFPDFPGSIATYGESNAGEKLTKKQSNPPETVN